MRETLKQEAKLREQIAAEYEAKSRAEIAKLEAEHALLKQQMLAEKEKAASTEPGQEIARIQSEAAKKQADLDAKYRATLANLQAEIRQKQVLFETEKIALREAVERAQTSLKDALDGKHCDTDTQQQQQQQQQTQPTDLLALLNTPHAEREKQRVRDEWRLIPVLPAQNFSTKPVAYVRYTDADPPDMHPLPIPRHKPSKWNTRVVYVPSVWREWIERVSIPLHWPVQPEVDIDDTSLQVYHTLTDERYVFQVKQLRAKINKQPNHTFEYGVYLYQRLNPLKPRYIVNTGRESRTYLQFIVDHYDDLPEITAFVHGFPRMHVRSFIPRGKCIRTEIGYVSACEQRMANWTDRLIDGVNIREWILKFRDALGFDNTAPEIQFGNHISFYCCINFFVSRTKILQYPLSGWKFMLETMAQPGSEPKGIALEVGFHMIFGHHPHVPDYRALGVKCNFYHEICRPLCENMWEPDPSTLEQWPEKRWASSSSTGGAGAPGGVPVMATRGHGIG